MNSIQNSGHFLGDERALILSPRKEHTRGLGDEVRVYFLTWMLVYQHVTGFKLYIFIYSYMYATVHN